MGKRRKSRKWKRPKIVPREEISAQNLAMAREIWNTILPGVEEEDEEGVIAPAIQRHLETVIEMTAHALDHMRPDPRERMGTIVVIAYKDPKKKKHIRGVKLRFKAVETVETTEDGDLKKRYVQGVWNFVRWDLLESAEGWKFQFEIDLTQGRPTLVRNFAHQEIISVPIWIARREAIA